MAKATAICRCKTCGNEFEESSVKRNTKEAARWEEWAAGYYDECPECRKKRIQAEREDENRKAAEEARALGLPGLEGSAKQVAWAETIRISFLTVWDDLQDDLQRGLRMGAVLKKDMDTAEEFRGWVLSHTEAPWWIKNRPVLSLLSAKTIYLRMREDFESARLDSEEEKPAKEILELENKTSSVVCEITATETEVTLRSAKDQGVIDLVKAHGYRWKDSAWRKAITVTTGSADDRLVELGNRLLLAGYPVKADPKYHQRIIGGEYEPETDRWVTWLPGKERLVVQAGQEWRLISEAAKIPGARETSSKGVDLVFLPVSAWQEVEDFARIHDFRISPGAARAIEEYKAGVVTVSPVKGADAEYHEEDTRDIMASSRDVLDDLREED